MRVSTYQRLLRHPAWLEFRESILLRDHYRCTNCGANGGATKKTALQVHHWCYAGGRRPWEYPLADLATLCPRCHALAEHARDVVLRELNSVALLERAAARLVERRREKEQEAVA